MKKKVRLTYGFAKVMRGEVYKKYGITIFRVPGKQLRVGVTVPKSIKGAVKRNRLKRYGREAVRKFLLPWAKDGTYVVIVSEGASQIVVNTVLARYAIIHLGALLLPD